MTIKLPFTFEPPTEARLFENSNPSL